MAARGRNSDSSNGAVVGMVIFGLTTLILVVICGFQISSTNEALADKESAEKELAVYIKFSERGGEKYKNIRALAKSKGTSSFAQLIQMSAQKQTLIGVKEAMTNLQIRRIFDIAAKDENTTLLSQYKKLQLERDMLMDKVDNRDLALAERNQAFDALMLEIKKRQIAYNGVADKAGKDLQKEQTRNAKYTAKQEKLFSAVERASGQKEGELRNIVLTHKGVIKNKEHKIMELKARLAGLISAKGANNNRRDIGSIKDGTVQAVFKNGQYVVLNLRRRDHIKAGMTFEIFSATTGIKFVENPDGTLKRGMATVEVVDVDDKGSTAMVVRQEKGILLQKGDFIANIAYDPRATVRFVVHGQFDFDGSGVATDEGRRQIEAIIHNYKAKIDRQVTFQTDFLVVGDVPVKPRVLSDVASQRQIERYNAALKRYNAFEKVRKKAKGLNVPILSQNRFMAEVGHYKR